MSSVYPLSARLVRFSSHSAEHLMVVAGTRIFDLDSETAAAVDAALAKNSEDCLPPVIRHFLTDGPQHPRPLANAPQVTALSLNLVQACNMGCGYCYAEQGTFGGAKRLMSSDVARQAIDRLLTTQPRGARVVIAYMGGEPFLARPLLREATEYAWKSAQRLGLGVTFAITTNATVIEDADAAMLAAYPFSVTVSIDGPPQIQDSQRPMLNGEPSSGRVSAGLNKLLKQRPRELTARISVTPKTGPLLPVLDYVLSLGFDSAGFAPVIASPRSFDQMSDTSVAPFTEEMIRCGRHALGKWLAGVPYRFSNLESAMSELHRGAARAHPCGAGAGYLSIDAGGEAFACHRLVGKHEFHFGSVFGMIDDRKRLVHLQTHAADVQEPCTSCWARYLCGGGCYHEVTHRGRVTCDYIRSWLAFCLQAYVELGVARPELFEKIPHSAAPGLRRGGLFYEQ